jgi:hypothetical protein
MRKLYSVAGALLLLGCMDDASKSTAPQLSGAVVGVSGDRTSSAGNQGGQTLDVTQLTGDEEVPVRVTDASGRLSVKLNKDGQSVDYVLDVSDIRNVTQAHIHMAARGVNGGIVVWLFPNSKSTAALPGGGGPLRRLTVEGTFTAADLRGALAGHPLADLIAAIEAGNAYGNVHTDDGVAPGNTGAGDFPGGEIRGQLDAHGPNH